MKNVIVLFLIILSFAGCSVIEGVDNCLPSVLDATFIIRSEDFYDSSRLKGCSVFIKESSFGTSREQTVTTESNGEIRVVKNFKGSCENRASVDISPVSDTTFLVGTFSVPKFSFTEVKGEQTVVLKYKRRTLPIILNIKHQNKGSDSLEIGLRPEYVCCTPDLFYKKIKTQNTFDSTFQFKSFPETNLYCYYRFRDKDGLTKTVTLTFPVVANGNFTFDIIY